MKLAKRNDGSREGRMHSRMVEVISRERIKTNVTNNRATAYLPTPMRVDDNRVWRLYAAVAGQGFMHD